MNAIALTGILQSELELRHTQDGLARLSVMLSFPSGKENEPSYQIRVIAFGNLAEEIHHNYRQDDCVIVEGRLQVEKRGKASASSREELEAKEKVTELIAKRFYPFGEATKPVQGPKDTQAGREASEAARFPASSLSGSQNAHAAPAARRSSLTNRQTVASAAASTGDSDNPLPF